MALELAAPQTDIPVALLHAAGRVVGELFAESPLAGTMACVALTCSLAGYLHEMWTRSQLRPH